MEPSQYGHSTICQNAIENDTVFNNFKSNQLFRSILEHVSEKHGREYIEQIILNYSDLIHKIDWNLILKNDLIGNTIKSNYYKELNFLNLNTYDISPTTMRYLFTGLDILYNFVKQNNKTNIDIIEVGCGYGGQCKVIFDLCHLFNLTINSYTIVDLTYPNKLQEKYLKTLGYVNNIEYISYETLTTSTNLLKTSYDLFISNYALGEFPQYIIDFYVDTILKKCSNYYIIFNYHIIPKYIQETYKILRDEVPHTSVFAESHHLIIR
jgi:hypothetical protein